MKASGALHCISIGFSRKGIQTRVPFFVYICFTILCHKFLTKAGGSKRPLFVCIQVKQTTPQKIFSLFLNKYLQL